MNRPLLLATVLSLGFAGLCAAEIDKGFLSVPAYVDPGDVPFPDGPICEAMMRAARPLRSEIVLGEPLVVQLRVKAVGLTDEKMGISFSTQPGVSVRVVAFPSNPRNGGPAEIAPYKQGVAMSPRGGFELYRDQVYVAPIIFAHDPNSRTGAAFDAPDTYVIEAGMNCIAKNPVTGDHWEVIGRFPVKVLTPEGDDEIAWNLMKPYDVYKAIQDQMVGTVQQQAVLREIVAKAPKAKVRPYALMALARSELADSAKDPKLVPRCDALLSTLLEEYPDHILAFDAASTLVLLRATTGDPAGARETFVRGIWSNPASSRFLLSGNRLSKTYAGDAPEPFGGQWMVYVHPRDGVVPESGPEADIMRAALGDRMADMLGEPVGFRYE